VIPVSTSAQLIAAGVIFAGFVAVFVIGRRRRPAGGGHRQLGTGSLYPDRGRTAWACDLCGDPSPSSSSRRVLRSWARHHAATRHPEHAHVR